MSALVATMRLHGVRSPRVLSSPMYLSPAMVTVSAYRDMVETAAVTATEDLEYIVQAARGEGEEEEERRREVEEGSRSPLILRHPRMRGVTFNDQDDIRPISTLQERAKSERKKWVLICILQHFTNFMFSVKTKWFGRRRREVKMRKEKRKSRGRLFLGSQEACAGRRRIKKLLLSQNWTAFLKQRLLQRKMSLLLQKRKLLPRRRWGRCNGGTPWPACRRRPGRRPGRR